jgi:hypothetical protein
MPVATSRSAEYGCFDDVGWPQGEIARCIDSEVREFNASIAGARIDPQGASPGLMSARGHHAGDEELRVGSPCRVNYAASVLAVF